MSTFVSSPSASNTDRDSKNPRVPQGLPGRGKALLLPRPCSQPLATPWPEEGTTHTDLPCLASRTDVLSPAGWEGLREPNIWRRAGTSMKAVPTSITSRLIHCHSGLSGRQGSSGEKLTEARWTWPRSFTAIKAFMSERKSAWKGCLRKSFQTETAQTRNSLGGPCHVPSPQNNPHTILAG